MANAFSSIVASYMGTESTSSDPRRSFVGRQILLTEDGRPLVTQIAIVPTAQESSYYIDNVANV